MKKIIYFFGFVLITILLELVYLNIHINEKINDIEKTQKQYLFYMESINRASDQTINSIDQSFSSKYLFQN